MRHQFETHVGDLYDPRVQPSQTLAKTEEDQKLADMTRLILRLCLRNIKGREVSEDDVQEGMLDALRAIRNYKPDRGTKLSTYVAFYVIKGIRTRSRSSQMKCRSHRPVSLSDLPDEMRVLGKDSPYENTEHNALRAEIAMRVMTPKQREAVLAYYYLGYDCAEIGKLKGLTKQAVDLMRQHGLRAARQVLKLLPAA